MKADRSSSPGFIALVEWAFRRFMLGSKDTEFRIHGGRFVEKHYPVGRLVVISSGYGRADRALTRVRSFDVLDSPPDLAQWERVYGPWPTHPHQMKVAAIGLDVLAPVETVPGCYPPVFSVWDREWIGFDRLEAIVREIPTEVWSQPRVPTHRPCEGAIRFHELVHKVLRRAPLRSVCDCTTIVVDELPDSDAFRRAYDAALHGGFLPVAPEAITLDRDGLHRGPGFVEGLPGPPSRLEAAYLSSPSPKPDGLPSWFPIDGLPFDFIKLELRVSPASEDFDGPHSPS